jgi:hypothetical protein
MSSSLLFVRVDYLLTHLRSAYPITSKLYSQGGPGGPGGDDDEPMTHEEL